MRATSSYVVLCWPRLLLGHKTLQRVCGLIELLAMLVIFRQRALFWEGEPKTEEKYGSFLGHSLHGRYGAA